jgi:hypothetical protein
MRIGGYFDFTEAPVATSTRRSWQRVADVTRTTLSLDTFFSGSVWADAGGTIPGKVYALVTVPRFTSSVSDVRYITVLGGEFVRVGSTSRSFLAAYNTEDNNLTNLQWNPNGIVRSITRFGTTSSNQRLILGGDFTSISGQVRQYIAAVSVISGASNPAAPDAWNPSAGAPVRATTIDSARTFVYAAGDFLSFGTRAAKRIAKCNIALSTAELWNTTLDVFGGSARAIAVGTFFGGSTVVAGGVDMTTNFVARSNLLNVTSSGTVGLVSAAFNGPVHSLSHHGGDVYVGGNFSTVGGTSGYKGLAKLKIDTGALAPWVPTSPQASPIFYALAYHGGYMYAGGTELKRVDISSAVTDGTWTPSLNGTVNALLYADGKLVVGDNGLRAVNVTNGASATWADSAPSAVLAITKLDNGLYAVGAFGARKYAYDTGVIDPAFSAPVLSGITGRGVAVTDSNLYVGTQTGLRAYRLNLDGSNTSPSLASGFNGQVNAVYVVSGRFVLFGGSMTLTTLNTKIIRSLVYLLES